MNLFTSSSKFRRTSFVFALTAALFLVANFIVWALPQSDYWHQFHDALEISKIVGKDAKVIVFGDSRATFLNTRFFKAKTLTFASPNNTILYSKLLMDRILAETDVRPQAIVLSLGANNFNRNGIFPLRDYAVRELSTFSNLLSYFKHESGWEYAVDGFFSKVFPVYGRRLEIRHPLSIKRLLDLKGRTFSMDSTFVPGMQDIGETWKDGKSVRNEVEDTNYWLIYRRSVYANFQISKFHTGILEELIEKAQANDIKVIVLQMPVEPKMRVIEHELVGDTFDNYLEEIRQKYGFAYLDKRDEKGFEFEDLNHLSVRGQKRFTDVVLNPTLEEILN